MGRQWRRMSSVYAFEHLAPMMSLLLPERGGGWREVPSPITLSTVMCAGGWGACCPAAGTGLWSSLGIDMGARQGGKPDAGTSYGWESGLGLHGARASAAAALCSQALSL